jgi:hypothetical protein
MDRSARGKCACCNRKATYVGIGAFTICPSEEVSIGCHLGPAPLKVLTLWAAEGGQFPEGQPDCPWQF